MSLRHLLPRVAKPGRYLGCEVNAAMKDVGAVSLRVALAFPDVYEVAFSHIGLKILYEILNRRDDIWAERVYAPWTDMEQALREADEPLFSLESKTPLSAFDWIGFSLQHELGATNILLMLELGRVPLLAAERREGQPFVVGGGPGASNPEPLAPFFDAFVLGDGEQAILDVSDVLLAAKRDALPRRETLRRLAAVRGVYVPSLYAPDAQGVLVPTDPAAPARVARARLPELDTTPFYTNPLVPTVEPVHNRYAVEIQRGCTHGCRFCQASFLYRPVRQRAPQTILRLAREGLSASGEETLGLLSLSASDYAPLVPVAKALFAEHAGNRVSLQLPSLRVETLGEELAHELNQERKTGFTLAPEAATERLRRLINKGNSEDDLMRGLEAAFGNGWRNVKLYFMIGLPTETDDDVRAIVTLGQRVRQLARRYDRSINVTVSVSSFVPKPHTPFQWCQMAHPAELRRKQALLKDGLLPAKLGYKWHAVAATLLEGALARGGRELAPIIAEAYRLGARFDAWNDQLDLGRWRTAFATHGLDLESYATRSFAADAPLPWSHLDYLVSDAYLRAEYARALAGDITADCSTGACLDCGVCAPAQTPIVFPKDTPFEPHRLVSPATPSVPRLVRFQYAKEGWAVFMGHLDTMSQIARAFHRARIALKFSEGFHPKPRLAFNQALPLGVTSAAEFCDAQLLDPTPLAQLLPRLNRALPQGLRFLDARVLVGTTPSLSEGIVANRYQFDLTDLLTPDACRAHLARLAAEGLPRFVREGKSARALDMAQFIENLAEVRPGILAADFLVHKGVAVKPSEFLAHALGLAAEISGRVPIEKTGVRFASRAPLKAETPTDSNVTRSIKEMSYGPKTNHQRKPPGNARGAPGERGDG